MSEHTVELRVGGTLHRGFIGGSIVRSLEQPASSFDLDYSPTATEGRAWPIEEGDECEIQIDGETILTGFVDRSEVQYDSDRIEYRVSGRSLVCDLVDCNTGAKTWRNKALTDIAVELADGFRCGVAVLGDNGAPVGTFIRARAATPATATKPAQAARRAYTRFKTNAGETVIEAIRRAAGLRGLHLFDSPDGILVISLVGTDSANVTLGYNTPRVLKGSRSGDWSGRFSTYHFCGQTSATDELTGKAGRQLLGEVDDPALTSRDRHRPKIIVKRGGGGRQDLGEQAVLERNRNAGRSERLRYTVNGWHDGNGDAWAPGTFVDVDDEKLRVQGRMIVVSARYRFGPEEPFQVELELTWPEAFDAENFPTRNRGDVWRVD